MSGCSKSAGQVSTRAIDAKSYSMASALCHLPPLLKIVGARSGEQVDKKVQATKALPAIERQRLLPGAEGHNGHLSPDSRPPHRRILRMIARTMSRKFARYVSFASSLRRSTASSERKRDLRLCISSFGE